MEDKKKKQTDEFDYLSNAASTQDCTGLIPSGEATIAELEDYEELYHFLSPKRDRDI